MKKILTIILVSLMLCGCNSNNENGYITKEEMNNIMEEKEYVILDVRTKEEYDEEHIKGAINISYDEIDDSVKIEKDKIIFVYCKSGNRSHEAYNTLTSLGYTVYDLGGISDIDLEKE